MYDTLKLSSIICQKAVGQAIPLFPKDALNICWLVPAGSETKVSPFLL